MLDPRSALKSPHAPPSHPTPPHTPSRHRWFPQVAFRHGHCRRATLPSVEQHGPTRRGSRPPRLRVSADASHHKQSDMERLPAFLYHRTCDWLKCRSRSPRWAILHGTNGCNDRNLRTEVEVYHLLFESEGARVCVCVCVCVCVRVRGSGVGCGGEGSTVGFRFYW